MMRLFALLITPSVTLLALAGCATAPSIKLSDVSEGQWRAKALIKDRDAGRSYIVNMNFNSVRGQHTRMDVTSTLGTGVASLLVEPREVRYLLFDSKRFYFGQPQADVMRPILAIPFDPRWIQNLLFEDAMGEKTWACRRDRSGQLEACEDGATGTKVTWSGRQGTKKTVLIEHPKASVQINVSSFQPKVEDRKNLFVLEAPEGYQKLRVR